MVDRLQAVYEFGFRGSVGIPGGASRMWLDVIDRAMAIGALAVAAGQDELVPVLALGSPVGMDQRNYTNWITHAAIHAGRAGFLDRNSERGKITFLGAVENEISSIDAISHAFSSAAERRTALAQFDALAAITVWGRAKTASTSTPTGPPSPATIRTATSRRS